MQHLLISGGTGLIGRHLIKRLLSSYKITVISRDPARAKRLLGDAVAITELAEITDLENIDGIINLAGEPITDKRWTDSQKQRICHSRWDITEKLVELIHNATVKPKVFISGSAVGFYGRQGDTPVTEDHSDCHDEFSREVCKRWEDTALNATDATRVCIIRTGVVLAEEGGALQKMMIPFRLGLGGPIGSGKQFIPWIHTDDMLRAIIFLLEDDACHGPFNVTSPNPNTNHFFAIKLAARLERPCFFRMPASFIKFLMGESSDLVLFGQKAMPRRLQTAGFVFNYPTLIEALDGLDL
ncbi:TIGR01777 family oxidoreductase [Agaribacter marinus]|uniref:Epimerase n=1 Tax=Agaribacter marinus TaxID=1431249 RepID=A0AA37T3U7_9ALTE|nr:TIGR01777 family oxidoreductase [Agaribacter marinus]GLR72789.1 epimerase [Agaribacter marinus]